MGNLSVLNESRLISIADSYMQNLVVFRGVKPIRTFGDNVELETKVDIETEHDVEIVLRDITTLGISKNEKRFERHHFFAEDKLANLFYQNNFLINKLTPAYANQAWLISGEKKG